MFVIPYLETIKTVLVKTVPALPSEIWWMPALILFILAMAALIDTISSIIPDPLIFLGLLAVTGLQGLYTSWPAAAWHLTEALIAAAVVWGVNALWYRMTKADAIGMGDAKWTMLAVSCFGPAPAIYAWGIGSCLAVLWLGAARLMRFEIARVFFAPFLFLGLLGGLFWLRLRDMLPII